MSKTNIHFFKSKYIKVFPCAYRGTYTNGIYDPEARLGSEYNFVNHGNNTNRNYVIDWTKNTGDVYTLKCVVGGYYFEIYNCFENDFITNEGTDYKVLNLYIKTKEQTLKDDDAKDAKRVTRVLDSWTKSSINLNGVLDDEDGDFLGLYLAESRPGGAEDELIVFKIEDSTKKVLSLNYAATLPNIKSGEGYNETTKKSNSVCIGTDTEANKENTFAAGLGTIANQPNLTVVGQYNAEASSSDYFIVGDGIASEKHNILTVSKDKVKINGDCSISGSCIASGLTVNGSADVTGALLAGFGASITGGSLTVGGSNFTVDASGNTTIDGEFYVGKSIPIISAKNSEVTINKKTTIQNDLQVGTSASASNVTIYGGLDVTGSALTVGGADKFKVDAAGAVTAVSYSATSDKRLKENIIVYNTEKSILDLPIYRYDFINGPKNQIGCLAQDLQEICPELVNENENGYLSIQENKLIYLLIKEVKTLKQEIDKIKKDR